MNFKHENSFYDLILGIFSQIFSQTQASSITDVSLRDAEESDELRSFILFSKQPTWDILLAKATKGLFKS